MYKKLMLHALLLLQLLLLVAAAPGQISNAAEEIDVPPEHRAAPPPMAPPTNFAQFAPPNSYPLFYQAALVPYGRYSVAYHQVVHPNKPIAAV